MTLEDIQQAIAKLSPEDRTKLRLWLAQFEAGPAVREPATKASKLGRLAGRAVADFRKHWLIWRHANLPSPPRLEQNHILPFVRSILTFA